ncbi:hypothetical protein [Fusibacter sp. 3D3]|uniref:hypothetical protein n=1 Tax=Fusibacter sp. 3D3 TaxID=1048380 RepID=UPI00085344F1|nr:hypothetical protein [Fusibacter sp. 3D3]GAU77742.1 hypothetical protein F3D3_2371 [Fusibacter sp. 3D3]
MWSTLIYIIIGLAALFIGVKIAFYAFFFILTCAAHFRKTLVEYCYDYKLSASPWVILVWESVWISELMGYKAFSERMSRYDIVNWLFQSKFYHNAILYIMIAIPFVILFLRARTRFLNVLAIKVLCIPLDLIYIIYSFFDSEYKPLKPEERIANQRETSSQIGRHAPYSRSGNANRMPVNGEDTDSFSHVDHAHIGSGTYNRGESGSNDSYREPIYDKYTDMHRVRSTGDSYTTSTVDGQTAYSTGDYIPFGADPGSIVERDSGYAPFGGSDD